ncbi:MAG: hypothetical protein BWX50_01381 [Euryarchaeota archaeon ADurb.Bin009]|nr:MAG: hypothetical protein BWX50_01381 [Euryarchaeota archaeon ADurb.Bin009]
MAKRTAPCIPTNFRPERRKINPPKRPARMVAAEHGTAVNPAREKR